jgi:hypothetical protein
MSCGGHLCQISYMLTLLRTLRIAVNQQTRSVSSYRRKRLSELVINRQTTILLFRKIVGFLEHEPQAESETILGYIKRQLDNALTNVRSPQVIYERVINLLLGRQYAHTAALLYESMHNEAGLLSSTALDAKMLALPLAFPHKSPESLILRISPIFINPQYTDNDFSGLLKMMRKYKVDDEILCSLLELFFSMRLPNRITRPDFLIPLLSARARLGEVDVALGLLDEFSSVINVNRAVRASVHAPYVQVLAALQETRTWDSASVNKVLDIMTNHGLPLNLPTLNILLSREVRLGNHRSAIAIYSMIKEMKTRKIFPDGFTFCSMFLLYRMIRPKTVRRDHCKNLASPFPPRALYRDFMLEAKPKFNTDRVVPSTTLMNVILRAFIRQRDYAGAFVVLNSFSFFKVPLDNQTYYRVIKHVVRRIWLEVSTEYRGEVGWSLKFLGVPDYRHIKLSEDLLRNLLAFVSRDTFDLNSPLYASRRRLPPTKDHIRYMMPSMEMIQSVMLDPQDFHYDPVPLKRILRRAILATLRLTDHNAGPTEVSKVIADAKVDMLPKIPQRHDPP